MATIKANKDKARFISNTINQDALDGDWVDHEVITKYKLPEIVIDAETSTGWVDGVNEKLVTTDVVVEGDKVRLYDGSNVVDGSLGTITNDSLVSSTNPLGDGSLRSKLEFENNVTDTTAVFTYTPTGITYGSGKFGQGAIFNGTSSLVTSSANSGLTGNVALSLSAAINISSLASTVAICSISNGGSTVNGIFGITVSTGGKLTVGVYGGTYLSTATLAINTLYTIAVTYDTSNFRIYINGSLDSTHAYTSFNLQAAPIRVGGNGYASDYFNGMIDQVEIYNRALTPTEVTTLYTQLGTQYLADITSFGLTTPPTKAFFNKTIDTTLSAEATGKCKSSTVTQIGVL